MASAPSSAMLRPRRPRSFRWEKTKRDEDALEEAVAAAVVGGMLLLPVASVVAVGAVATRAEERKCVMASGSTSSHLQNKKLLL